MARRLATMRGSKLLDGDRSDRRWCHEKLGAPVHDLVEPYAVTLMKNSSNAQSKNRARERIYEGHELVNNRAAVAALETVNFTIARLNATKSIIDTFVSRLSQDRPMPDIQAIAGDWKVKRKAKKFREFVVGKMTETEFDDLTRDGLLDGAILGNAFTRIDDNENDVFAERIPVSEMIFDPRECRYGRPQQAMRSYRLARDYLAELFPSNRNEIRNAPNSLPRGDDNYDTSLGDLSDYVDVYEAWHLPSTSESEDGRHAIVLANTTLLHERWYEPRFPWAHLRLFKPRHGLLGVGFVDQLASLQHRVNCIVRDLQLNLAATGRGHFLVNENNDIPTELLSGWQPFKLKYKGGQPPQYVAPTPFNQAQLNALEFFINKMYDLTGVSQANAESKNPLGPDASGVALNTQYDIDSTRFAMPQANYARYRLDGAQCYLDASQRIARRRQQSKGDKKSYVAVTHSWANRDSIDRLDYDKVALEQGSYCLQIQAQNYLPDTRAGKLAVVSELAKAGVIEQWLIPTLFDEPDLVEANGIILAAFQNAMRKMDELADEDMKMPYPEQYNDLDLELKLSTAFYNRMQKEGAPPAVQDRYRQYIDLVVEELKKKTSAAQMPEGSVSPAGAPMAPGGGMLPGGAPPMAPAPMPPPGGAPIQ